MFFKRSKLVAIMRDSGFIKMNEQFHFLNEEIKNLTECEEKHLNALSQSLTLFMSQYKSRWIKSHRIYEVFQKNNKFHLFKSAYSERNLQQRKEV